MPDPILSEEQWETIKLASVKGVSDSDLAVEFGVSNDSIRQRRHRDPIWKAALTGCHGLSQKPEILAEKQENAQNTSQIAQKLAVTVADSISKLGEQNRLLALQIAGKGLKQADRAPPDVQSWQDVKALMDIVAKASGMDQAQAVQVNVLSSQPMDFMPHFEAVVETGQV
jgi:hypothetical protein